MAQTLLIGLGGTGSRVVNNVVKELHRNGKEINNGEICCAVLDTNVNDNDLIKASQTGVPVIATSKVQKIRDYLADYHYLNMEDWCPQSPTFLEQTMIDGASELRAKSRVAFMDCLESGVIEKLELMINDVLKNTSDSKIRIMIVSSLSGGTGSGMFIQVALWLRKFLAQSDIVIRGIFLLPDVFVRTIKDIRENEETKARQYCNAYAAIRELNAITKIRQNNALDVNDLPEKILLDGLFDSSKDYNAGKPVYDFAFFVDDRNEKGVRLKNMREYEQMVAQLVYMQLFAPIKKPLYSEEDNTFLSFVKNREPLYGACGTSKAEYPTDSVKTYCAIRAAQDALTVGWKKIDDEIEAEIKEKEQGNRDGIFSSEIIDKRERFIKLYEDKVAVTPENAGKDKFFLTISKDAKNEERLKSEGGKVTIKYTDKVDDFIQLLKCQKIDTLVNQNSGTDDFELDAKEFVATKHSAKQLEEKISEDERGLEDALDAFDKQVNNYADTIVSSVFPYSMGDINPENRCTIYGLLTKPDGKDGYNFVHPVAARYILCKLVRNLEKELKTIVLDDSRANALSGGDVGKMFDNKATGAKETTAMELLKSRRWFQSEASFLDKWEEIYAQFITVKIGLCITYEVECLRVKVFNKLIARINELIKQFETFFNKLGKVHEELGAALKKNVRETEGADGIVGTTLYVYGRGKDKEAIYNQLDLELERSNNEINMSVLNAIYGYLCAEKRPSIPANKPYGKSNVVTTFVQTTIAFFKRKIGGDANNRDIVNMDIYTALCKLSDTQYEEDLKAKKEKNDGWEDAPGVLDDLDFGTNTVSTRDVVAERHQSAFTAFKKRLYDMAASSLIKEREISNNKLGTVTTRSKTFWGFHPSVVDAYPSIGTELGIDEDLQSDDAYPRNELYCYRAVYGLAAEYIPKFNELTGGKYYTCYREIIDEMVRDAEGSQGESAYVRTPHLDKNWHSILPYVTKAKQEQAQLEFYRGFWLAVAYGKIDLDKDGNFVLERDVDSGYGNTFKTNTAITYKGKSLGKADVLKLLEALRRDKLFTDTDIPALEEKFAEEREDMTNYVDTEVMKGLTTKKDELNPIDIVSRYSTSRGNNKRVSNLLVGALEAIAGDLAASYNLDRSEKKREEAKYSICKKIYDSSKRTKGKPEIFGQWEEAFGKYKIKDESAGDSAKATPKSKKATPSGKSKK